MMKKFTASLALLLLILCATPATSLAWSPFGGVCTGATSDSAVCQDKGQKTDPLTGNDGLLMKITNIVALIAGTAAVIIIVLSGLRFIQSNGSSEDVAGARRGIIYSVVGLIIIVLARSLIVLVISKL